MLSRSFSFTSLFFHTAQGEGGQFAGWGIRPRSHSRQKDSSFTRSAHITSQGPITQYFALLRGMGQGQSPLSRSIFLPDLRVG